MTIQIRCIPVDQYVGRIQKKLLWICKTSKSSGLQNNAPLLNMLQRITIT
uniref:Uncharacterized protein n=1 Tax=Arundo donax TaxID=35708 RepID=A0A0A9EN25_ARUDO